MRLTTGSRTGKRPFLVRITINFWRSRTSTIQTISLTVGIVLDGRASKSEFTSFTLVLLRAIIIDSSLPFSPFYSCYQKW